MDQARQKCDSSLIRKTRELLPNVMAFHLGKEEITVVDCEEHVENLMKQLCKKLQIN